jgi:hypothetical protein
MLKPRVYILQEILFSPVTVLFNPSCTPLEDPVRQREEGQPPLTPTGKDPCLRIFPGDDFIRILPIFFKTPIEFVQLLLSDGNFVGIGRYLVPELDRQSKLVGGRKLLQLGNLLLDHVDQSTVQRAITQLGESVRSGRGALSYCKRPVNPVNPILN